MNVTSEVLNGVLEIQPRVLEDVRGSFVKPFQKSVFDAVGLDSDFREHFYTMSNKDVIRAMHFQLPPLDHHKFVYCLQGHVWDVVVDLRAESATFGEWAAFDLTSEKLNALYLPKGFGHGYAVLSDSAIVSYSVTEEFDPTLDTGIAFDSFGIPWPVDDPILSDKDKNLLAFADWVSPFDSRTGWDSK